MPNHSPDPPRQVHAAKERMERGERLRADEPGVRLYYCRTCGVERRSLDIPIGWYLLSRQLGPTVPKMRLGIYCSIPCLEDQMARLEGIAERHTLDELAASQYAQKPTPGREEIMRRRIRKLQNRDIDLDNQTRARNRRP